MTSTTNRRGFLGTAAASSAAAIVPRHVLGGPAYIPPSDKLNLAHIGMGTQSFRELASLLENPAVQIVAVCDPNTNSNDYIEWGKGGIQRTIRKILDDPDWGGNISGCPGGREVGREVIDTYYANQRGADKYKAVATYADYRELLEKEPDVDAVKVMTPDHLHAAVSIAAMKKGAHVVMHKPVANRMHEGRLTLKTQRQTKTLTHLLAHGSGALNGRIAERVKEGAIGRLREIHNWSNRPVWPQYTEIPTDRPPVPGGFDWDLWLGPALYRPFHPCYTHTTFRGWYDFGGGSMADMGNYSLWPVFTALDLDAALSAEAYATHACWIVDLVSRPAPNDFSYPAACQLRFKFAAKGTRPEMELFWYDGGMKPRLPEEVEAVSPELKREGILFVGDKGSVLADFRGSNAQLITSGGSKPLFEEQPTRERRRGDSTRTWVEAFQSGRPSPGDFRKTAAITDTVNLGTVALRSGKKVLFDSKNMKITNIPEADKYLYREYRPGWEL